LYKVTALTIDKTFTFDYFMKLLKKKYSTEYQYARNKHFYFKYQEFKNFIVKFYSIIDDKLKHSDLNLEECISPVQSCGEIADFESSIAVKKDETNNMDAQVKSEDVKILDNDILSI